MLLLIVAGAAGFVVGATITTAVILLRAPDEAGPAPHRQPLPSGSEEAQRIHACERCGKRIVKARESDRQHWRIGHGRVEYYHAACWDDAAGEPKA